MNPSYLVGNRLKEERERLGLSQAESGLAAGVSREMWGRYERGALPGGEVFIALGNTKFDVLYILTGQRSQPVAPQELLPEGDRILLNNFHAAPDVVRAGVKTTLSAFAHKDGERVRKKAA